MKDYSRQKAYYERNKEKIKKYRRDRYLQTREKELKQMKEYYENNKTKINKYKNEWIKKRRKDLKCKTPWELTYINIEDRLRCNKKTYKKRQIKNHLTIQDIKRLWFRDKAFDMKKPSIDRINNKGNYAIENCRYVEALENLKKGLKERWSQ